MGLGLEGDWNVTGSISQDPRDMKMHSLATGFLASTWQKAKSSDCRLAVVDVQRSNFLSTFLRDLEKLRG
jgi:hypothetical protein